uniref:Uncharacterized protein n=1 Tax=Noctiluca scintillans TaxID=2966 RepID=A0A7S1AJI4_NOCSC
MPHGGKHEADNTACLTRTQKKKLTQVFSNTCKKNKQLPLSNVCGSLEHFVQDAKTTYLIPTKKDEAHATVSIHCMHGHCQVIITCENWLPPVSYHEGFNTNKT